MTKKTKTPAIVRSLTKKEVAKLWKDMAENDEKLTQRIKSLETTDGLGIMIGHYEDWRKAWVERQAWRDARFLLVYYCDSPQDSLVD